MPQQTVNYLSKTLLQTIAQHAAETDINGRFPEQNLAALKKSGLMGLLVPVVYGGLGGTLADVAAITEKIARVCLTTSVIWSMHCQQVAVLVHHASEEKKKEMLPALVKQGWYIGSVTTEDSKGGHLLSAVSPLAAEGEMLTVNRVAPIITGGAYCDAFLITMKKDAAATDSDVRLVFVRREEGCFEPLTNWNAMGMRGTASVRMRLEATVPASAMINDREDFRDVAIQTMIPAGHFAWAAGWLGAAKEAYNQTIGIFRDPAKRQGYNLQSDLLLEKLGRIRLDIDTADSFFQAVLAEYQQLHAEPEQRGKIYDNTFQLKMNNLKIYCSETLFSAVNRMVDLLGLKYGYVRQEGNTIERIFRDMRAGSLMFHNDRLLVTNGKLSLISKL